MSIDLRERPAPQEYAHALQEASARSGGRLPNLFVVGAPRSGTTSLHHFLTGHPSLFMSELKEPGFFVPELDSYPKDPQWYLRLFEDAGNAVYVGESSTHYAKLPQYTGVPERIASACDDPRFIYLMRDPIDRAISNYWHSTRQHAEFRSPLEALQENSRYCSFGDYARQLSPYFEQFPWDRIFTETFERLIQAPAEVTSEIFQWLGVSPSDPQAEFPERNATPDELAQFQGGQTFAEFLHGSELWKFLSPLVPQALKDLGKQVTWRSVDPSSYPMEDVKSSLRPWARDVADRTSQLLDRDFPEWSTTRGEG